MKVLQINCVYKFGSTGKIVFDLHKELEIRGVESFVCYGRGQDVNEKNVFKTSSEIIAKGYNVLSRFTGIQYGGAWGATKELINKIEDVKPDIVHLHCINGFFVNVYSLLKYLKKRNINTVLTLHAEFMYTGSCGHALECEQWMKESGCKKCPQLKEATGSYLIDRTRAAWHRMKKAFEEFDNLIVVSVSPWLKERAEISTILRHKRHKCVFNGIDVANCFFYSDGDELRKELGLLNKKIVLYVTAAFSEFKGGEHVMNLAKLMSEVSFVVVGNKNEIANMPDNMLAVGRVENQNKLARYYSMADVTVLTSKKETFSMVCAESLACGTPVVGFKAGAPEKISLKEYSAFCEYGDISELKNLIEKIISNNDLKKNDISKKAKEIYSKEKMCDDYLKIYEELLDENQ